MKELGKHPLNSRPLFSETAPHFPALSDIELPSSQIVLLLIADATDIDSETIYSAAASLIDRGAIYVCTWGPGCERVHDIFDEADVGDGNKPSDDFIMTTWHNKDSLEETIGFFLTWAIPIDQKVNNCSWLALTVGDIELPEPLAETIVNAIHTA